MFSEARETIEQERQVINSFNSIFHYEILGQFSFNLNCRFRGFRKVDSIFNLTIFSTV